jgi:hypothetical protein
MVNKSLCQKLTANLIKLRKLADDFNAVRLIDSDVISIALISKEEAKNIIDEIYDELFNETMPPNIDLFKMTVGGMTASELRKMLGSKRVKLALSASERLDRMAGNERRGFLDKTPRESQFIRLKYQDFVSHQVSSDYAVPYTAFLQRAERDGLKVAKHDVIYYLALYCAERGVNPNAMLSTDVSTSNDSLICQIVRKDHADSLLVEYVRKSAARVGFETGVIFQVSDDKKERWELAKYFAKIKSARLTSIKIGNTGFYS